MVAEARNRTGEDDTRAGQSKGISATASVTLVALALVFLYAPAKVVGQEGLRHHGQPVQQTTRVEPQGRDRAALGLIGHGTLAIRLIIEERQAEAEQKARTHRLRIVVATTVVLVAMVLVFLYFLLRKNKE